MGGGGEDATRAFAAFESYLRGHDVFRILTIATPAGRAGIR